MSDAAFYWIGVGAVGVIVVLAALAVQLWIYINFLHGRFGLIFFRKGQRRLSLASWYNSRLMSDEDFHADDWPIGRRPFYLSYRVGNRRLFVLAGRLEEMRNSPISGKHPEDDR